MVDCSVIIVNWNVAELLAACLDSLLASPVTLDNGHAERYHIEIIVVDSASSDGSVTLLRERYPQVITLAQSDNVGFTRGNNLALSRARGRHLLLLNPDTVVHADALPQMIAYLDAQPDVGIVGPHTLNTDGSTQSSRRHFPDRKLAFFESTWLQPLAPQAWLDEFYVKGPPDDAVLDVDWVQGSALMARREVYAQIGGLDEAYTMFYEELDWCRRAKDAGWRVVYLGSAQITHHGGQSTQQVSAHKHIYFQQSKLRYFRKHHGGAFAGMLRVFLLANYLWQLALESVKGLIGSKRDLRRERVRVYWQVLRSGLRAE